MKILKIGTGNSQLRVGSGGSIGRLKRRSRFKLHVAIDRERETKLAGQEKHLPGFFVRKKNKRLLVTCHQYSTQHLPGREPATFRMLRRSLSDARNASYDPESKTRSITMSRDTRIRALGTRVLAGLRGRGTSLTMLGGTKQLEVPRVTCYNVKSVKGPSAWKLQTLVVQNLDLR
jgi:hypothetical protein